MRRVLTSAYGKCHMDEHGCEQWETQSIQVKTVLFMRIIITISVSSTETSGNAACFPSLSHDVD